MMNLSVQKLQARGFVQVRPNVFVRLQVTPTSVGGVALWRKDATVAFAGARIDTATAKRILLRLAQIAATAPRPQRVKARRVLGHVLAQPLRVAGDDPTDEDLEHLIRAFAGVGEIGAWHRGRLLKRLRKLRRRIHRLASRMARNHVMQRLRRGYANLLEGPLGKVAAKATGYGLSMFGIPPKVTETMLRARHARIADRMRHGGWAGTLAEATGRRGLRGALADEAKRFGNSFKKAAGEGFGGLSLDHLAKLAHHGKIGALVGEPY